MKKRKSVKVMIIAASIILMAAIAAVIIIKPWHKEEKVMYMDPQLMGLSGYNEYIYDVDNDEDSDGLPNGEENRIGTDVNNADTDEDGLTDYDEVNTYNTDPLEADTDGDGLEDGYEVAAGLNPLEKRSDGKTDDKKVKFERELSDDTCTLTVAGNALIYGVAVEKANVIGLNQTPGVISEVYEFYSEDKFENSSVTFSYDANELEEQGINVRRLSICQFTDNGEFERVASEIDEENCTVTATLLHYSKYALCNMDYINTNPTPQVLMVIDNSGSMYPEEMCEGSEENDVDFKRIDLAIKLVDMAHDEIEFGLAKFTADYTLMCKLGSDVDSLTEKLESIKTDEETFNGTYIETSLIKSIEQFSKNDNKHRNFVVMITDGYSTEGSGLFSWKEYDEDDIIEKANDTNVSLIIIGLGNNVDKDSLTEMAAETDGMYVSANNADALDEVYNKIMAAINYNLEDSDGDGENDRILLADSGFVTANNGFPYQNYVVIDENGFATNGQCYGIASLSQLYYMGELPLELGKTDKLKYGLSGNYIKSSGYELNDSSFFTGQLDGKTIVGNTFLDKYTNVVLEDYQKIIDIPVMERYTYEDENLEFSDEVKMIIEENPLLTYINKDIKESKYEDWTYTSYDCLYVNLEDVNEENLDADMLEAYTELSMIYRLYAVQLESETSSFTITTSSLKGNAQEEAMDKLITLVQKGTPVVISAESHAINVTRIYRSLDDANEYTVIVYNNNNPKEEFELTIKRRKNKAALDVTEWVNDYIYTIYDSDGTFTGTADKKISFCVEDISWLY